MKELGKARVFTRDGDEPLIEAFAPVAGGSGYRQIGFKAALIDYVFAIDDKLSGITLNNGVTIPVALEYAALKKRLYSPEADGDIDLTAVTGKAVGDVQAVRLAKTFNPAATQEGGPKREETKLEVIMFAHGKAKDREFRRLRVLESQIGYFEPHADRKDKETFVQLKEGVSLDGWTGFYVAMPMQNFMYYLNDAKQAGREVVDLCEATRPKTTTDMKLD